MKKLLLSLLLLLNLSDVYIPVYASDISQDTAINEVVKDYRTHNEFKEIGQCMLMLLGIGLILLILISPIILWNVIYSNLDEDSGLKYAMHLVNIILIILTLGLICLRKKR